MSVKKDYVKELEVAREKMEAATKNYYVALEKKLMSEAIKRGIAEAKAKKR
ncbi:MAG: hypothetical protein UV74_C0001G0067 [Candidatus Woesebacteria bacterium GW2011_GWB1_43_14]|uniref:Uncharacterized protein n=1 Tax=Candidatus Woesebacteria bacterium GW2011_GWB1_43_14 TaxID=1618578 RepID=A0A0G1DN07_9BACT|nr:MAG: hypothetical protein UT21_C0003G0040 [Candidatus Woesebacteria bacterium GW2011_GWA1_39_11b]KKS78220.1 MAG: hypothetical protein UV51_C0002G0056 [Candidatus Woesebacteria bacterium GW2011_GWC1_42_9]KKS98957.1 MAG: hypothetical protein UV74_C0001G0067 [Candidatus Woesebacteria bacterium GW2011_GWB1_43_14]